MTRILIDADGCPVVNETIALALKHGAECVIMCDTAHQFQREGASTIVVSKGADSVDFALVNLIQPGDIVVTQDYGLAAMCLARRARPLNQDGRLYTHDNIEGLLAIRHEAKKARKAGQRVKGPAKRTGAQDEAFCRGLEALLASTETTP